MLDNQDNTLPDATENQSNDKQESLKDEVVKENLEAETSEIKITKEPELTETIEKIIEIEEVVDVTEVQETELIVAESTTEIKETTTTKLKEEVTELEEIEEVQETEKPVAESTVEVKESDAPESKNEVSELDVENEIEVKETEKPVAESTVEVEESDAPESKNEVSELDVGNEIAVQETKKPVAESTVEVEESDTPESKNKVSELDAKKEIELKETKELKSEATTLESNTETVIEKKKNESQDAVDEIEKKVAKDSENLHHVSDVPLGNYEALELGAIVTTIESLMAEHPIQAIKKHVDALKKVFNKQFGRLLKESKTSFLEEGGNAIDFHYENPIQEKYNKVLHEYKNRFKAYYKELEKKYEDNLLQKRNLIEELKELIDNGEANSMYKHFNEIQKRWREIGPVSRESYSDLWRTYHFHVERFYDLLHLRNDLRDLDFKHNLEEKLKLIARVEVLAESDNIKDAFNELQEIHRLWKEEIGPVSRENRDVVWERFSVATNKIHDKRHNYYDSLKEEFKENLSKKKAIIERIANYDTSMNKKHNDWQKSIKEIAVLREEFFSTGKVPRSKNNEIWEKFKEATKIFNKSKNNFYKEIKNEQNTNLELKMKLVAQAESLRDSEDWENATDVMKKIQSEWKGIGHVPRKLSDKIWNQFKEACNHYFDRLHNKLDVVNEEKFEVYAQKKEFLNKLKDSVETEGIIPTLEDLKAYINEWNDMGAVPLKQRYINGKFNKFLDDCFAKLNLDIKQSTMIRYQNMINGLVEQKDYRKLDNEIQFVRQKLEGVTKEKQQLENNMQFFSNADESNPMIKNILTTIEKHEKELSIWEAKLQYLRTISV